jgi:RNA polymerase-interacting CarD/CdnL/TRCF family regulator
VIAFFLRDSGRRLARWSAQRQKTREERALLNTAILRNHMLKSQLDALEALRQQRSR